jgi:hypothetical protein
MHKTVPYFIVAEEILFRKRDVRNQSPDALGNRFGVIQDSKRIDIGAEFQFRHFVPDVFGKARSNKNMLHPVAGFPGRMDGFDRYPESFHPISLS